MPSNNPPRNLLAVLSDPPEAGTPLRENAKTSLIESCVALAAHGTASPLDAAKVRERLADKGLTLATVVKGVVTMRGAAGSSVARRNVGRVDLGRRWWSDLARLARLAQMVDDQRWRDGLDGDAQGFRGAVNNAFAEATGLRWDDATSRFTTDSKAYRDRLWGPPQPRVAAILEKTVWGDLDDICSAYVRLDLPQEPARARAKAQKLPALLRTDHGAAGAFASVSETRVPHLTELVRSLTDLDGGLPHGRDVEAASLSERFADGGVTVVVGPPGVGKSHLTGWLQTGLVSCGLIDTRRTMSEDAVGDATLSSVIGRAFARLPPRDDADQEASLDTRLTALVHYYAATARDPLLLVLDGIHHLEDSDLARLSQVVLGPRQQIVVVASTVSDVAAPGIQMVTVAAWPEDVAAEFLVAASGRPDRSQALEAARMVDCVPIWCQEIADRAAADADLALTVVADAVAIEASGDLRDELRDLEVAHPGGCRLVASLAWFADTWFPNDLFEAVIPDGDLRDELVRRRYVDGSGQRWTQHQLRRRALLAAIDPAEWPAAVVSLIATLNSCVGDVGTAAARRRAAEIAPHADSVISHAIEVGVAPADYVDVLNRIGDVTRKQENYPLLLAQRTQLIKGYCTLLRVRHPPTTFETVREAEAFAARYATAVRRRRRSGGDRVAESITALADFAQAVRLSRRTVESLALQRVVVTLRDKLLGDSLDERRAKDRAHAALGLFLTRVYALDRTQEALIAEAVRVHEATLASRQARLDDTMDAEAEMLHNLRSDVWSSAKSLARSHQVAAGSPAQIATARRRPHLRSALVSAELALGLREQLGKNAHTEFTLHAIEAELALIDANDQLLPDVRRREGRRTTAEELVRLIEILPRFRRPGSQLRARRDVVRLAKKLVDAKGATKAFHPGMTRPQWARQQISWAMTESLAPPNDPDVIDILVNAGVCQRKS